VNAVCGVVCERPGAVREPVAPDVVFAAMGIAALILVALLVARRAAKGGANSQTLTISKSGRTRC